MPDKKNPQKSYKNILFWLITGGIIIILWSLFQSPGAAKKDILFSQFMVEVEKNSVEKVTITGNEIKGTYTDGAAFKTIAPEQYNDLVKILREHNVQIEVKDTSRGSWFTYLFTWFPFILIIFFFIFFMRQMQSGGNKALSFGKSRAKLFSGIQKKVTFKDVAGVKEAKEELQEIIGFLKDPKKTHLYRGFFFCEWF
mgnify:CR=1 FL=1